MLEDIAVLTDGAVISEDLGIDLRKVTLEDLGRDKKVMIDKDKTIINLVRLRRYPATPWAFKSFPALKRERRIPTGLKLLKSDYPAKVDQMLKWL